MKFLPLAALLLIFALPAQAQDSALVLEEDLAGITFTEIEKRLIRNAYSVSSSEWDRESWRGDNGGEPDIFERMDEDGNIIKNWKRKRAKKHKAGKGLPPGLAKRGKLPPGLVKFKKLPPGLKKRTLPKDLKDVLPVRKKTERVIVGDNVLLINKSNNLVLDILRGVVRGAAKK